MRYGRSMAVARRKARKTLKKRPTSRTKAAGPFVTVSQFEAAQERTDEQFRYLGAVLEDVRSQNRATIEAVLGQRQETKRLIEDLESRITPRLEVLESVVRDHSQMLHAHGHALESLNQKVDKVDARLGVVEQKVDKVDERLGVVEHKVDGIGLKLDTKADASLEPRVAALERAAS